MSASDDRVQEALAAYIEQHEVGGPTPDTSHLSEGEREKLDELIALLDLTEGVAFGRALEETDGEPVALSDAGARLVAIVRDTLPAARIAADPAAAAIAIGKVRVSEGWMVGTFGGRVRVWQLAEPAAFDAPDSWLRELGVVFRMFSDTAAIALVDPDESCLIVVPEDCAPAIEVPRGALVARRYRRPVQPVSQALSAFFRELIPAWEPIEGMPEHTIGPLDVSTVARDRAAVAVAEQAAAGARARKTNPKRKALTELGEKEAGAIEALVTGVHEGRVAVDALADEIRRSATKR